MQWLPLWIHLSRCGNLWWDSKYHLRGACSWLSWLWQFFILKCSENHLPLPDSCLRLGLTHCHTILERASVGRNYFGSGVPTLSLKSWKRRALTTSWTPLHWSQWLLHFKRTWCFVRRTVSPSTHDFDSWLSSQAQSRHLAPPTARLRCTARRSQAFQCLKTCKVLGHFLQWLAVELWLIWQPLMQTLKLRHHQCTWQWGTPWRCSSIFRGCIWTLGFVSNWHLASSAVASSSTAGPRFKYYCPRDRVLSSAPETKYRTSHRSRWRKYRVPRATRRPRSLTLL